LTEVLTGESAGNEVDGFQFGSGESGDVFISFYFGPVLREDLPTEGIDFHLPPALHSGAFQAEIDPADAGE
jgi:hypothetical protein